MNPCELTISMLNDLLAGRCDPELQRSILSHTLRCDSCAELLSDALYVFPYGRAHIAAADVDDWDPELAYRLIAGKLGLDCPGDTGPRFKRLRRLVRLVQKNVSRGTDVYELAERCGKNLSLRGWVEEILDSPKPNSGVLVRAPTWRTSLAMQCSI